jgi:outer membrane protease
MKNITALTVLVIIFLAITQNICAQRNYAFSLGLYSGFLYGQAMEYVYPAGETQNDLLSELKWDMKPLFYLGLNIDFYRITSGGFFASLNFKAGIPAGSGYMEDRDWLSPGDNSLTRFSKHTNKTSEYYSVSFKSGYSFPLNPYFYVKPYIHGAWTRFAFTGKDGYGYYSDSTPPELIFSGNVIRYKQDWLLLAAGLSLSVQFPINLTIDLSFQISPLTYCIAEDEHILGNTVYRDYSFFGLYLEPAVSLSYKIRQFEISLDFAYRYIGRTSGLSYTNNNNLGFSLSANKAGAGLSLLETNLLFKINL